MDSPMNMLWPAIALVVIIVGALAYVWWQSQRHMIQLVLGFPAIQKAALNNVQQESQEFSPEDIWPKQYFQTVQKFGCAYTIECSADKSQFVHHLSGKAPGKSAKFVMENMLLLMAVILSQLKKAGIDPDAANAEPKEKFFVFEQSDSGTQHLEFKLTASQQTALQAAVASKPS
jgi:hypothetical protein